MTNSDTDFQVKHISDHSENHERFREIIVRSQWLHRVSDCPFRFRVQIPDDPVTNERVLTPTIFFINKHSGGRKGEEMFRTLVRYLNPHQIFLLEDDRTLTRALQIYSSLKKTRICICGGDGTVSWVLNHLTDAFPTLENPPASIIPLGTGNDLSRVLAWGSHYRNGLILKTLEQIPRADPVALDRWQIHIEPLEINESRKISRRLFSFVNPPKFIRHANLSIYDNHRRPIRSFFFNYLSIGLDAAVVLDFHAHRTRDASRFTSPLKNKFLYINESRKYFNEFAFGLAWNLKSHIRLIGDGQDFTDSLQNCHSLVILNIPSFGSGTRPWGTTLSTQFTKQDYADGKLEIFGLNTIQMALIHLGFRAHRIAQCRQLRIELIDPIPAHMDGEPFYLAGSTAVNISHAGQVMVLNNISTLNSH